MTKNQNKLPLFIIIAVLLLSNLYMSYRLVQSQEGGTSQTPGVNQVSTEFETNITKLVEDTKDKVVSVISKQSDQVIGSGSGIVYKNEAGVVYIVTNHHVIDKADHLTVRLADGTELDAKLIGSDAFNDLALLSITTNLDLEPFKLGDSNLTKVGEFVIAIGSPLGVEFQNSVTFGIISGKDRIVPVDLDNNGVSDWDMVVMQTDAAINPGNSGGALVNLAGELIGINSLKLASNNVEGMGFAIPVSEMIEIIKQIEETGKVSYPVVGISAVSVQDLNPHQKQMYGIDPNISEGVYIAEVTPGGPAQSAGLQKGDILVEFDQEKVSTFKEFRKTLYKHKVGDVVSVSVIRDGKPVTVEVTLG